MGAHFLGSIHSALGFTGFICGLVPYILPLKCRCHFRTWSFYRSRGFTGFLCGLHSALVQIAQGKNRRTGYLGFPVSGLCISQFFVNARGFRLHPCSRVYFLGHPQAFDKAGSFPKLIRPERATLCIFHLCRLNFGGWSFEKQST